MSVLMCATRPARHAREARRPARRARHARPPSSVPVHRCQQAMRASTVALYYHKDMEKHTHEWPHIEKCTRASSAYAHLSQSGVLARCLEREGRPATDNELATVHTKRHIDEVKRLTEKARKDPTNRQLREPDGPGGIYYSADAEHCARLACGCVIDAAFQVLSGEGDPSSEHAGCNASGSRTAGSSSSRSSTPAADAGASPAANCPSPGARKPRASFALVRPPGHHAGYDDTPGHRAEGFCFFNSVAVAAGCVLRAGKAKRICIIDWDVHHGNGTQKLFYDDGRVLYISLHRFGDRWYPETGEIDETGDGDGAGRNVNIPWPENGCHDSDYIAAWTLIVLPIVTAFAPDLLLLSAGFDAAEGDAQGRMRVTPMGFAALTTMLLRKLRCPVAAALEGGYHRLVTSQCCEAVIRVLLGERLEIPPSKLLSKSCEPTLRAVLKVQQKHWPCLRNQEAGFDKFFAEASLKGQPERVSKRQRVLTTKVEGKDYDEVKATAPRGAANAGARAGKQYRALMMHAAAADKTASSSNYYADELPSRRDELS